MPTTAGDRYVSRPEMNLATVARHVVGHTGDHAATVLATEAVDNAVAQICAAAHSARRWVLLVGDHGNAERM